MEWAYDGMGEDCTSEGRIELARQTVSLSDSTKQAANGQPDLRAKIKAKYNMDD